MGYVDLNSHSSHSTPEKQENGVKICARPMEVKKQAKKIIIEQGPKVTGPRCAAGRSPKLEDPKLAQSPNESAMRHQEVIIFDHHLP